MNEAWVVHPKWRLKTSNLIASVQLYNTLRPEKNVNAFNERRSKIHVEGAGLCGRPWVSEEFERPFPADNWHTVTVRAPKVAQEQLLIICQHIHPL